MEDSGNWLYIILAVIAGISGIISSVRKKREQAEASAQPAPRETELDDWWQTLETPQPQQATQRKEKVAVKKTVKKFQPVSAEPLETDDELQDENQNPFAPEAFRNIDEVKKAVIYSEILNRKY